MAEDLKGFLSKELPLIIVGEILMLKSGEMSNSEREASTYASMTEKA